MVERSKIPDWFIALLHGLCVFGSLETAVFTPLEVK